MDKLTEFYESWLGVRGGREILPTYSESSRDRLFITSAEELEDYVCICRRFNSPAYISVQPYKTRDQVLAVEKLFFEFDCPEDPTRAWEDAKALATTLLKYYDAVPLVKFSGRKGYHVDVWLREPVTLDGLLDLGKTVYKCLQMKLLMGLKLQTLDPNVIGDLKRLERVPYSTHEKTGLQCQPVDLDGQPVKPEDCNIDEYRRNGLSSSLIKDVLSELQATRELESLRIQRQAHAPTVKSLAVRPCIEEALTKPLHGASGHKMRLAIAIEYLRAGLSVDEVVQLFQSQTDFNPEKTRYYVEHAKKKGYRPLKCQTIRELGFCLGSSCSRLQWHFWG